MIQTTHRQKSHRRPLADPFATVHRSANPAPIPAPLQLSLGEFPVRFGKYEVLQRLGEGQMGSVFLAHDTRDDRRVAIKVSKLDHSKEVVARFARESRVMARLQHRNICPAYEAGEVEGVRYFAMGYVEGEPLVDCLTDGTPWPGHQVASLIRKLALAIGAAHEAGVIHRDLKPANIIIDPVGEPVVMDFGLARSQDGGSIVTRNGAMIGTPAYMPPEQALGQRELTGPASDIYSLGVVMYQLLAGRVPFDGKLITVLKQIVSDEPPPPSQFGPGVDQRLEAICLQAMSKSIELRFSTAVELAKALSEYLVIACISEQPWA